MQLLAALKHPLAAGGIAARRVPAPGPRAGTAGPARHPACRWLGGLPAVLQARDDDTEDLRAWLAAVTAAVRPVGDLLAGEQGRLGRLLEAHLALAEWLAADAGE